MKEDDSNEKGIGALGIAMSVVAAAFGVQSRRNRERDFTKGNVLVFIAAGLIFTALFVGTVALTVNLVLGASGP